MQVTDSVSSLYDTDQVESTVISVDIVYEQQVSIATAACDKCFLIFCTSLLAGT